MNKKLIALAVAGSLAAPMLAHAEAPTVYGKVHLYYGTITEKSGTPLVTTADNWQMQSYASRFGVKGEHDLGGGLAATYKFEWEVNPLDSTDSGFSRRNMYGGLKGGWGEVRFGRHDTPLKMSQGKFDQFNDTLGDLKHAGDQDGENRLDNVLAYLGKSGNISYAIALIPGQGDGVTVGDGPADTISASIAYSAGPLYVAVAHDSYDSTNPATTEDSLTRVTGTYKFGSGMQLGLLWQSGVEGPTTSGNEEDWLGASFSAKFGGSNKFKAQYIMTEDNAATKRESTLMAVGVDHKFSKKVTGYVMYSSLTEDLGGAENTDNSSAGVGLVVKF
ncbi:MAG: porin [Thiohalophilus sp.]|jgi:predicted porin